MSTEFKPESSLEIIDLTSDSDQGSCGNDKIEKLVSPGRYRIPIRAYLDGDGIHHQSIPVEVVSVFIDHGTQLIVVPDNKHDYYFIFYYNGSEKCFKPNFDPDEDYLKILNWINIEVETDKDGNVIN